jgi:hypothetical protein
MTYRKSTPLKNKTKTHTYKEEHNFLFLDVLTFISYDEQLHGASMYTGISSDFGNSLS